MSLELVACAPCRTYYVSSFGCRTPTCPNNLAWRAKLRAELVAYLPKVLRALVAEYT
jgi:hypothetical protein